MAAKSRKSPPTLMLTDEQLRSSIIKVGCLLPVLRWKLRILDGHRRLRIALGVGQDPRVIDLNSRSEAAASLWIVHPERALCLFPEDTLQEAADLYGTTPSQVAAAKASLEERPPTYPPHRMPWHRRRSADLIPYQTDGKALNVRFRITPELRERMRVARTTRGQECTEAAFIRRAIAAALDAQKKKAPTR